MRLELQARHFSAGSLTDEVTEAKQYRERIVEADTSYGIIYDDKEVDKLAKELGVKIIE